MGERIYTVAMSFALGRSRAMVVKDEQVRILWDWLGKEASLRLAAAKAGMDRKTARKYRQALDYHRRWRSKRRRRNWRTREDPFSEVWSEVEALLEQGPGWEAKTLFEELQRGIRIGSPKVSFGACSGGSSSGGPRAGRTRRCSSPQQHVPGRLGAFGLHAHDRTKHDDQWCSRWRTWSITSC